MEGEGRKLIKSKANASFHLLDITDTVLLSQLIKKHDLVIRY